MTAGDDGDPDGDRRSEGDPPALEGVRGDWPSLDCRFVIERRDAKPDRCTIYPAESSVDAAASRWIAAVEGHYVSLDDLR